MKKIIFGLVILLSLLCIGCRNVVEKEVPPLETTMVDTMQEKNENKKEDSSENVENIENDFFVLLDDIKNVHPGTAGCSIQVLISGARLLNICKLKLPFDLMANAWVEKQDKNSFSDINESFSFVLENIDSLDDEVSKEIIKDNGMENEYIGPWDEMIKNIAKAVLNAVIEKTKK